MSLPPPWEPHVTDEGARYYYNPDSGDFVWSKNLPAGGAGAPSAFESDSSAPVPDADVIGEWALYYDSTGNGYYSNSATGESKWAQPDDWVMYCESPSFPRPACACFLVTMLSLSEFCID